MSQRFAVIKTAQDGQEEIIDIKLMEGAAPELQDYGDSVAEEVGPGPEIGMVRGGPVASVDGFGFREGDPRGPEAENEQEIAAAARDQREFTRETELRRREREAVAAKRAEDRTPARREATAAATRATASRAAAKEDADTKAKAAASSRKS